MQSTQNRPWLPAPQWPPGTFHHGIYLYILTLIDKTCSKITLILTLPLCPKWNKEVSWVFPGSPGKFHSPWKKPCHYGLRGPMENFHVPCFQDTLENSMPPGKIYARLANEAPWNFPGTPGKFRVCKNESQNLGRIWHAYGYALFLSS